MSGAHVKKSFKSKKRDKPKHSILNTYKCQGEPKKGGAGGKGIWGKPGDELKEVELDPNDPNYDPQDQYMEDDPSVWQPEEPVAVRFAESLQDLNKFKQVVKRAALDYISSNQPIEVEAALKELGLPIYHQELPSILIKLGLDLDGDSQKKIEKLIFHLYKQGHLTSNNVAYSLKKLYNSLDDLLLDAPNARVIIKNFASYAVLVGMIERQTADQLDRAADMLADAQHVQKIKQAISNIIDEFFESEDLDELRISIDELKAPHLVFEVVKKLVSKSLDRENRQRELASRALAALSGDFFKVDEVCKGFSILLERVEDLVLDVPDILRLLSCFVARAVIDEAIPPAFLVRLDLGEHDMGYQVVKQASVILKADHAPQRLAGVWHFRHLHSSDDDTTDDNEPITT